MKALLVRVGADQSEGGGSWNGPVYRTTGQFAYVPIPETKAIWPKLQKPYGLVGGVVRRFGCSLPPHLATENMHLDPDFSHLTYGDQGERAKQIQSKLIEDDLLVFYAGLADTRSAPRLIYAIIGLYVIDAIIDATTVPRSRWDENAHTRRVLSSTATDIVVQAKSEVSGRLDKCLPIGTFRNKAYRVTRSLLNTWGGLSCKDGYLQRSARLPEIENAAAFYDWFQKQGATLIPRNN